MYFTFVFHNVFSSWVHLCSSRCRQTGRHQPVSPSLPAVGVQAASVGAAHWLLPASEQHHGSPSGQAQVNTHITTYYVNLNKELLVKAYQHLNIQMNSYSHESRDTSVIMRKLVNVLSTIKNIPFAPQAGPHKARNTNTNLNVFESFFVFVSVLIEKLCGELLTKD